MERLYSILEIMKIKDIVRFHSETTMPIPDVVYHLYSLPSFDNNQTREELLGQDIQSNKFTVPNRCILFNKLNVRFKRIWRIDSDEDHKIASTEFLPLIIDENKVDFAYCFYLLASPAITDYLCGQNANTSGSHKRIDPTNFFNIGIKLPPLAQQYEIGKLLSSLDAKIKLNRQINQLFMEDLILDFNLYLCEKFGYRNSCSVMQNANGFCVNISERDLDCYIRFWEYSCGRGNFPDWSIIIVRSNFKKNQEESLKDLARFFKEYMPRYGYKYLCTEGDNYKYYQTLGLKLIYRGIFDQNNYGLPIKDLNV